MRGLNVHLSPSTLVNASRIDRISKSFQETGLFSETHLVGTSTAGLPSHEDIGDGRTIVRIPTLDQGLSIVRKIVRTAAWYPQVYRRYRKQQLTAVNAHTVFTLPVAWALSRKTGSRLIYNPHELETGVPTMIGAKLRFARAIEARCVNKCDLVTVVNESIADWYEREFSIPRPLVVRNIPLREKSPDSLRQRLDIDADELLFVHTGHLVDGRNIPAIVNAFESLPEYVQKSVVFVGEGPMREIVRDAAVRSPHVHWLPPVPAQTVVNFIEEADVALCLIDTHSLSYRLSSPNKLFEALSAGVPPLCSDLVEARRLMREFEGEWVLREPKHELVAAITRIEREDVSAFKRQWVGLGSWVDEIAPTVNRLKEVVVPR